MRHGALGVLGVLCMAALPLGAQRGVANADLALVRYGAAITTVADSVLLRRMAAKALPVDAPQSAQNELLQGAQRLVGAFDAVVPPSGLSRLHAQLVGAAALLTAAWLELDVEISAPLNCPTVGSCTAVIEAKGLAIESMADREERAALVFRDARERATRMLADRGVVLAPLVLPPPRRRAR